MRIQYCSDLHLEFEQNRRYLESSPLPVSGEILILAGDIVPLHDEYLIDPFFAFISKNYKQVFWVPGNHEFYYKNISDYSSSFNIQVYPNINIVNNIYQQYEGIHFVFSTLWSRISQENRKNTERSVSDFECIRHNNQKFNATAYNELHERGLEFIKQSLSGKKNKTVVVTHHLPSVLCNSAVHNASPINEAFCVDLTEYIEESHADFWIYGHSHFNQKPLFIGDTIMLTNQLGYVRLNEQGTFKHNAYFSV
ncbi:MAG: metallophosphoesterase [Bacteroidota bacterium]